MYRTVTIADTAKDLTEDLVLMALASSENPGAQPQADLVRLCWKIYHQQENKDRREKFRQLRLMYQDRQEKMFRDEVLRPLMGKDADGLEWYDKMPVKPVVKTVNMVKRFVDKQATLYDDPPARTVMNSDGTENEKATVAVRKLAREMRLDVLMQNAERAQVLYRTAFLRPVWRNEEPDIDLLLPEITYPVTDPQDHTRVTACFWVSMAAGHPDDIRYATWYYLDAKQFFWFQVVGNNLRVSNAEDIPGTVQINENTDGDKTVGNTLGELGIIRLATNEKADEVVEYPGDSLVSFQHNVNLLETLKNNSLIFQGFPILHLHGLDNIDPKTGERRTIKTGPWSVITTEAVPGQDMPSINWVAPQANVDSFVKALDHEIDTFLLSAGVPKNLILSAATSGAALAERNRDIVEIRKAKLEQYRAAEQEIYRLLAIIEEKQGKEKLPADGRLVVDYVEPEIESQTRTEQLADYQTEIDLGINSPLRILMDEQDLDADEAKKRLDEIKQENAGTKTMFGNVTASAVAGALGAAGATSEK